MCSCYCWSAPLWWTKNRYWKLCIIRCHLWLDRYDTWADTGSETKGVTISYNRYYYTGPNSIVSILLWSLWSQNARGKECPQRSFPFHNWLGTSTWVHLVALSLPQWKFPKYNWRPSDASESAKNEETIICFRYKESLFTKISLGELTSLRVVCKEFSHETWGFLTEKVDVSSVLAWKASWRNFFVRAVCILGTTEKGGRKWIDNKLSLPFSQGSSIISWKLETLWFFPPHIYFFSLPCVLENYCPSPAVSSPLSHTSWC